MAIQSGFSRCALSIVLGFAISGTFRWLGVKNATSCSGRGNWSFIRVPARLALCKRSPVISFVGARVWLMFGLDASGLSADKLQPPYPPLKVHESLTTFTPIPLTCPILLNVVGYIGGELEYPAPRFVLRKNSKEITVQAPYSDHALDSRVGLDDEDYDCQINETSEEKPTLA